MTTARKPLQAGSQCAEYEGATLPRNCADCGREYLVSTVEAQQSTDDVCRPCFEAFNGATLEELFGMEAKP